VVEESLILVQEAGILDIPNESNASTFRGLKVISQTIYVLSLLDFLPRRMQSPSVNTTTKPDTFQAVLSLEFCDMAIPT
jgi:hypothetical protein